MESRIAPDTAVRPKLVLAGGSGFIGRALVDHFSDWDVVVLNRHDVPQPGCRVVPWDGKTMGPWVAELAGAEGLINLSGAPVSLKWSDSNKQKILSSRVESTSILHRAIAEANPPPAAWVNASAVGFYGDRKDEILDETSSPGTGFLPEVCQAWEAAALSPKLAGTRCCVLRTGVVLGKDGGALQPLEKLAKFGLGGAAGSGRQWMPWIHIDDLCRMYRWLLASGEGPVNGCAPKPITNRDFMAAVRRAVKRPWSPPVPGLALAAVGKLFGPDPEVILSSDRVIPKVAMDRGFKWNHPSLESALAASLSSG